MPALSNFSLEDIMHFPLPTITEQKRLCYRPSKSDVIHIYTQLNEYIFRNEMTMPVIDIRSHRKKYWGMCVGETEDFIETEGSTCSINLMDKWFCPQWTVTIIAHEMAHQYQWDILGPKRCRKGYEHLMSHGPSFFVFRSRLERFSIPLKTAHSMRKWFKYQDLFKC